jgi:hypothetical protein
MDANDEALRVIVTKDATIDRQRTALQEIVDLTCEIKDSAHDGCALSETQAEPDEFGIRPCDRFENIEQKASRSAQIARRGLEAQ